MKEPELVRQGSLVFFEVVKLHALRTSIFWVRGIVTSVSDQFVYVFTDGELGHYWEARSHFIHKVKRKKCVIQVY